ncbi:MAG: hypothetical protein NC548_51965 [Lachnospiraceae bacterium]|nr:hypothetical protein [Lachnospiraceae bacterium]
MANSTITLLNGKSLELFPLPKDPESNLPEVTHPCTDFALFAQNANLLLGNAELIMSDSRLFMSPIDMCCGLSISGRFKPTTLGAYLEWWINHSASRDNDGNPVLHLAGSALSGCNRCTSVDSEGQHHSVVLSNFSGAWHSFLTIRERYRDAMYKFEAYPLEKVIEIVKKKGISNEVVILQAENRRLQHQLETEKRHFGNLTEFLQKKTDEYLKAILAPRIKEAQTLYRYYNDATEYAESFLNEQRRIKNEAKQKLKDGNLSQEEYRTIKKAANEKIAEIHYRLDDWWLQHFIRLYGENARFFSIQTIKKYMD